MKTHYFNAVGVLAIILLSSDYVSAAWDFTPSITSSGIYTDNVTLERGSRRDEDFLIELTPSFNLKNLKGRFTTEIDYELQNIFSTDDSDRNESFHILNAVALAEILRDKFFVKFDASNSQVITSGRNVPDESNALDINDRADQFTFNVNPYLQQNIGTLAQLFLSYEYGFVDYEDDEVDNVIDAGSGIEDEDRMAYEARISSFPDRGKLGWELFYLNDRTESDDTNLVDKFERYGGRLDYKLLTNFTLIGIVGDENNSFEREVNSDEPDGSFWEAGFAFQPNKKHFLEVLYGDRNFGNTWNATWRRLTPKTTILVEYSEDITNETRDILDQGEIPDFNTPERDLALRQQVFVQERLDASFVLRTGKSTYTLNLYDEQRDFEIDDDDEERGAEFIWLWRFASKSQFQWDMGYSETEEGDRAGVAELGQDEEFYNLGAMLQHNFTPRTIGFFSIDHNRLDSDSNIDDYEENTARIGATITF